MFKGGSSCLDFFVFNFPEASHCTVRNIFRPQLSILNSITNIPLISITAPDSSHHHLNQTFWTCLKLKLQEKQCWIGCYFNILYWWAELSQFPLPISSHFAMHFIARETNGKWIVMELGVKDGWDSTLALIRWHTIHLFKLIVHFFDKKQSHTIDWIKILGKWKLKKFAFIKYYNEFWKCDRDGGKCYAKHLNWTHMRWDELKMLTHVNPWQIERNSVYKEIKYVKGRITKISSFISL